MSDRQALDECLTVVEERIIFLSKSLRYSPLGENARAQRMLVVDELSEIANKIRTIQCRFVELPAHVGPMSSEGKQ